MRIIIVEDEPITRMDIRCILEDAGFEVLGEGKDGFDAINLCKEHHQDMVLIDINMPNLDGVSAAKIIRRDKLSKGVVFLTAYSDDAYIEGAKKAGAFGYIVKPIDENRLVPALKIAYAKALELVGKTAAGQTVVLNANKVTLATSSDTSKVTVAVANGIATVTGVPAKEGTAVVALWNNATKLAETTVTFSAVPPVATTVKFNGAETALVASVVLLDNLEVKDKYGVTIADTGFW